MSLQTISPLFWWLGLAGLAAALFALQRLRVRHREVTVVTTLFWREALEEARARVLVERFRHPLAYLLFLAFVTLVWLAAADPRGDASNGRPELLVLDASAGMARGSRPDSPRFDAAREALFEHTRATAAARRTVVALNGGVPQTLLAPGEDAWLLARRLEALEVAPAPAGLERALMRWASWDWDEAPRVRVYGDAPVRSEALELLPDGWLVERVPLSGTPAGANRGITALGIAPARSGNYDRVDAFVEVDGDQAADAALTATVGGRALEAVAATVPPNEGTLGGRKQWTLADLPADGSLLSVALDSRDELALDDRASIVLPVRRRIPVAVAADLDDRVRLAVASDPGLLLAGAGEAAVVIRREGDSFGGELPAIEWSSDETLAAFRIAHTGELADGDFTSAMGALGLDQVDTTGLARDAGAEIRMELGRGDSRSVAVWASLLGPGFDFVDARAFPLFLGRTIRWLSGESDFSSEAAAGEPLRGRRSAFDDAGGRRADPIGLEFTPARAGEYVDAGGDPVSVSLLDAATTRGLKQDSLAEVGDLGGGGWSAATWLALLALLVLWLEWVLVRSSRIP